MKNKQRLDTLYDERSVLNNLIDEVSSVISSKATLSSTPSNRWLAPIDRCAIKKLFHAANYNENKNTIEISRDIVRLRKPQNDPLKDKIICFLETGMLPQQWPLYPSDGDVRARITAQSIYFTLHSISGYSFSSEFTYVYKGRSTWSRYNFLDNSQCKMV